MYILYSQKFDKYYTGSTDNLDGRIALHNSSKARWTKRYQPWVLRCFEKFSTRSEAVKRERYVKSFKNIRKFLEMIEHSNSVG